MSDKAKKAKKGDKPKGRKKAKQADTAASATAVTGIVEELREAGAKIVAVANSPAGREAIAVGLSIAATAAQAAITAKRSKAKLPAAKADPGAEKPPTKSSPAQDPLVAALGGVAETVLARLFPKKG